MTKDENEMARRQIIGRKARIADVDRILARPPQMGPYGKLMVMGGQSRAKLVSERLELLCTNDAEERRLERLATEPQKNSSTPAKKLKLKKQDLSNYFDSAGLTDLQRACMSLKFEYELPIEEIARRMGKTRSTIYGHITAAERKMDVSRIREKALARIARIKPGRTD